jgi:glycosyltransferase involved in cell wall biosynthesis
MVDESYEMDGIIDESLAISAPRITVLMSVFNDARYVSEAIESILNQTLTDFEFLIINDGSTDSTPEILGWYARQDDRIRIFSQDNIGLTKSLNRGLKFARGEYIARMDADDISLRHRLQTQQDFLDAYSEIAVLSSGAEIINEEGHITAEYNPVLSSALLQWRLLFGNCLLHSTVMFRKDVIVRSGSYPADCLVAQDYDLWAKLLSLNAEICQLPEILIQYRQNKQAISFRLNDKQIETSLRVVQRNIRFFFKKDVSRELVQALCDSENVRSCPVAKGELIAEAINCWLNFKEVFLSNQHVSEFLNSNLGAALNLDISGKILSLSRANAGYYSVSSLRALLIAIRMAPSIVTKNEFWFAVMKAVIGQTRFQSVKNSLQIILEHFQKWRMIRS